MSAPLVSIVIPCYNGEAFVADAIESALAQTHLHREVILVDDGSTDGSLDVIRSFGDAVVWRTGPNRGGSAARNTGLALARGRYIQFLDADDVIGPTKIARQAALLEQSGADVCVSRFRIVENGRMKAGGPAVAPDGRAVEWFLRSDVRLCPLYRAQAVGLVGAFDETLACCQDFDLNLRLALADARFVHDAATEYEIRRRPGSVSHDERRLYQTMLDVLLRAATRMGPEFIDDDGFRAMASKASSCARWLLRFGEAEAGLAALETARRIHPSAGLKAAYSGPARALVALVGPVGAERVLWRLRRLKSAHLVKERVPTA